MRWLLECGYRIDLVVERKVVVELKCVEAFAPVHEAIMLTYLRLSGFLLGLLINFNVTVLKNGIKRFVYRPVEERKTLRRVPQRDAEDTEKNG